MISIKNVTKQYNSYYKAVNNLNIKINSGNILGLIGPNGAGKTSTINMIIGLTEITHGNIEVFGYNIKEDPCSLKRNIGYVSDNPNKFMKLKAIEYLNFIADIYKVPAIEREKQILNLSKKFYIDSHLNKRIESFSKGMKQKIMIIASLIHEPKLWILDEPFTGLDPEISYKLKEFMKEYARKGNIILISSHILEIVENLCTKLLIIESGESLYFGDIEELKDKYGREKSLENIYLEALSNNGISKII